jgi:hypothetical protein
MTEDPLDAMYAAMCVHSAESPPSRKTREHGEHRERVSETRRNSGNFAFPSQK